MSVVEDLNGQMVGQFRLIQPLPQARSGLIYHGRDLARTFGETPAPVWLQLFDRKRSRRADLIRAQADAWRAFQHPAYLPIVGCETPASELALLGVDAPEGMLLSERLADGPLAAVDGARMALLLAEALADAHHRGLANLAISEESIVLPRHGTGGPQFFGFATAIAFERTDTDLWHYLAPEQIMSQECDERADVYALGVVLFRSVTGHYPIEVDATASDRVAQLVTRDRSDPRRWLNGVGEPIAQIIERCIQPNRNERFPSGAAVAEALRASGALLPEVERETSDPRGIVLTPPPKRAPEKRATAEQETLSPTPAPEIVVAVVARSTTADRHGTSTPAEAATAAASKPCETDLIGYRLKELRIESRFAEGGMSELYVARHMRLPRTWLVKVASAEFAKRAAEWFEQEAHVTALLRQHGVPRVVEVIDCDWLPDGRPYMVMEFIQGTTLERVLSMPRSLPIDDCIKITDRISETLERAHDLGIVHRDIKPPNIMLEDRGGRRTNNVIVLDWGVSKAKGEDRRKVTDVGTIIGTPGYMAPEQAVADVVDGRADTFAVATMMYEMLAGRPAFEGTTKTQLIIAANNHHPPRLSEIRPEIDGRLSDVVATGMRKEREARPDMRAFRKMLREYAARLAAGRPSGAPTPIATNISTVNPLGIVPLARKATLAAVNPEKDEVRLRAIEPEVTRPLRSAPSVPRGASPKRSSLMFFLVATASAATISLVGWLSLRHAEWPAAPPTTSSESRSAPTSPVPAATTATAPPATSLPAPVKEAPTTAQTAKPPTASATSVPREEFTERNHPDGIKRHRRRTTSTGESAPNVGLQPRATTAPSPSVPAAPPAPTPKRSPLDDSGLAPLPQ